MTTEVAAAPRMAGSSPIVIRNSAGEWLAAIAICYAFFQFMWTYHDLWRGKPYSLATSSECLALAATYGLGLALAFGPLSRLLGGMRGALRLRRPLGVVSAACGLAHALLVLGPLRAEIAGKIPSDPGITANVVLGVISGLLFILLAGISWQPALTRLGARAWKRVQSLGWPLLAIILTHFMVLGKVQGWQQWFATHDKPAPQGTLWMFIFGVLVLLLKGVDLLVAMGRKRTITDGSEAA